MLALLRGVLTQLLCSMPRLKELGLPLVLRALHKYHTAEDAVDVTGFNSEERNAYEAAQRLVSLLCERICTAWGDRAVLSVADTIRCTQFIQHLYGAIIALSLACDFDEFPLNSQEREFVLKHLSPPDAYPPTGEMTRRREMTERPGSTAGPRCCVVARFP